MLLNHTDTQPIRWRKAIKPSRVIIPHAEMSNLHRQYAILPTSHVEFGGLLCGRMTSQRDAIVTRATWMPSHLADETTFSFDKSIIERADLYCGSDQILGMWHSHSRNSPLPSSIDRKTTHDLGIMGCVLSDRLKCFAGTTDIPVIKHPHL